MLSRLMTTREQLLLLGVAVAILIGAAVLIWRGSGHAAPPPDIFAVQQTKPTGNTAAPSRAPDPPQRPAPPSPNPAPTAIPASAVPPARIGVGILGAVEKEGLYYFDQGARLRDLLQAAGGVREDADLSDINRTALLIDQTTLLVPRLLHQGNQAYSDPPVTHNPAPDTRSTWYQFNKQTHEPEPVGSTSPEASPNSKTTKAATNGLININTAAQAELESLPGIGPATAQKIIAYRRSTPFQTIEDLDNVSGIGPSKMNSLRGLISVK